MSAEEALRCIDEFEWWHLSICARIILNEWANGAWFEGVGLASLEKMRSVKDEFDVLGRVFDKKGGLYCVWSVD